MKQKPSWLYALLCLISVGIIFYVSYNFTNYLSAQRSPLAEIAFAWESKIPFIPWTIVPYWSLNFFYALAFFLCRNKIELHRYIAQLLLAQGIAIICFLLFPLQFSWAKPPTSGLSAWLFRSLAAFDAPYNQAPSLHIMLTMIVGRFYWQKLPRHGRIICLLWSALIMLSVLTTYQHHFIDIPTAILASAWIWWLFPLERRYRPPSACAFPPNRHRWQILYLTLAVLNLGISILIYHHLSAWGLWLSWLSASFILLGLAYGWLGASALQKKPDGLHSPASTLLLLPYYLIARLNIHLWLYNKPLFNFVDERLAIGSILGAKQFNAVIDLCAEYPLIHPPENYHTQPLLDMITPSAQSLQQAAQTLDNLLKQTSQPVLVCCALGYSRSAAVILTYLMNYRHQDFASAQQILQASGRQIILSASTRQTIIHTATLTNHAHASA